MKMNKTLYRKTPKTEALGVFLTALKPYFYGKSAFEEIGVRPMRIW